MGGITSVFGAGGLVNGGSFGDIEINLDTPIPVTNGGTGAANQANARGNLFFFLGQAVGDMYYRSATGTPGALQRIGIGSVNQVLTVNPSGNPQWMNAPGGPGGGGNFNNPMDTDLVGANHSITGLNQVQATSVQLVNGPTTGNLTVTSGGVLQFNGSAVGGGGGVSSFNTLTGAVTLAGGNNVTLTPTGNTITIDAAGGSSGVSSLNTLTGAVTLAQGNNVTLVPSGNTITINAAGGAGGGNPAGPNNAIQLNDNSVFGGSSNLVWDGSRLEVIGAAGDAGVNFRLMSDGGDWWVSTQSATTFPGGPPAGGLAFWNGTPALRMVVTQAGNVGIGVGNPTYRLSVNGDINTSGAFRINGQEVGGNPWTGDVDADRYNLLRVGQVSTQYLTFCNDVDPSLDVQMLNGRMDVGGAVNATEYYKNGVVASSQWTNIPGGIAYMAGRVGIGVDTPGSLLSTGPYVAPIKVAVYDWGSGVCCGIGVTNGPPHALTFGADINPDSGIPQMILTGPGYLGIGTAVPTARLTIKDEIAPTTNFVKINGNSIYLAKSRGTEAVPASIQAGDYIGYLGFSGFVSGVGYADGAWFQTVVTGVTATGVVGDLVFATSDGASANASEHMRLTSSGSLRISSIPGRGVEIGYNPTSTWGGMENYNYSTSTYEPLFLQGSMVLINHPGTGAPTPGYVGIGMNNPQYTLDVNGDIQITGHIYRGGVQIL